MSLIFNQVVPPDSNESLLHRHITKLAFLNRFTDFEAIAIDLASLDATIESAMLRRYKEKVNAAVYIDLDLPETRSGVIALETAALLTPGRALEILDNPIQDHERANVAYYSSR